MKKSKIIVKNKINLSIAFLLGSLVAGSYFVYAMISATNIYYTTDSGTTDLNTAINNLSKKTKLKNRGNFISSYTYNESTCVTGEESTCVRNTCYQDKQENSCKTGDIIKYKVNDSSIVTFHVMYDSGNTITMQSQRNTIYTTSWITRGDYLSAGGSDLVYTSDGNGNNNKGPLTILAALESATAGWSNVEDQTYSIGDDTTTLGYSGCSEYNNCESNTYTLDSRTAKSRMITVQEAEALGCTQSTLSCPIWMINYLHNSTTYRGTENDTIAGTNYWTMSAHSSATYSSFPWVLDRRGFLCINQVVKTATIGARAVVVVSK